VTYNNNNNNNNSDNNNKSLYDVFEKLNSVLKHFGQYYHIMIWLLCFKLSHI